MYGSLLQYGNTISIDEFINMTYNKCKNSKSDRI